MSAQPPCWLMGEFFPATGDFEGARIGQVELRIGASGTSPDQWTLVEVKHEGSGHVRGEIPAASWVGKDLALGVKIFGVNRRDAGWSNFATVMVMPPLARPADVKAAAVACYARVFAAHRAKRAVGSFLDRIAV